MKKRFFLGCIVALSLGLSACGYRGALYLPQDAESSQSDKAEKESTAPQPESPRDSQ